MPQRSTRRQIRRQRERRRIRPLARQHSKLKTRETSQRSRIFPPSVRHGHTYLGDFFLDRGPVPFPCGSGTGGRRPASSDRRSSSPAARPSAALADQSFALGLALPIMAALSIAMVLVKPTTVVQWHRRRFRLYWRWRSRSRRPSADREVCELIREMSSANRIWGAPRIHGEMLKLGIEISQATVAK